MFPRRIFYWCGLTATQPFNTGIQRVTRCLASSLQKLGVEVIPVKSHGSTLALINQREADHLAKWGGPRFDMAQLTLPRRLVNEWVLIPEMTPFDAIGIAHALRMRSAPIFYDMIPLKMPELYNAGTLDWMIPYWRSFSKASVVLPISNTVSADLLEWQTENNLPNTFRSPCLLSGEIPGAPRGILKRAPRRAGDPIHLLAIGSREPRKNYPKVIRAVTRARRRCGVDIRLSIVGRQMNADFPEFERDIKSAAEAAGNSVVSLYDYVPDGGMRDVFAGAHATIYGSWVEGFGLPVLESLWQGLPCICHNGSALAEIAPGGGTIMADMLDENEIARAIELVATDPVLCDKLADQAISRPLRTWTDYASDIMQVLRNVDAILEYDPLY